MIFNEHYELSMEQQMCIELDSLPNSWNYEKKKKALIEHASKLRYKNIVVELN